MAKPHDKLDKMIDIYCEDIYRFCFLLLPDKRFLDKCVRQTFLQASSKVDKDVSIENTSFKYLLFGNAYRICENVYYSKIININNPEKLQKNSPIAITEPLNTMIQIPLFSKAVIHLSLGLGFSLEDIGRTLNTNPHKADLCLSHKDILPIELYKETIATIPYPHDYTYQINDEIFLHFDQHNVGFETNFYGFKYIWDRILPYIAAGIIILFIASALLTD